MWRRWLQFLFVGVQAFWMLVVLPGHVRGMVVVGPGRGGPAETRAAGGRACCAGDEKPITPSGVPSPERQQRCAVCYQAVGYDLPPVYDFDFLPAGLCPLCRLTEPGKLHRLPCRPTYFANGPPAGLA